MLKPVLGGSAPSRPVSVLFGGQPDQEQKRIRQTLANYRKGLESLVVWDRKTHRQPVFKRVDVPALLKQGAAFLTRRANTPSSVPTPFMIGMSGGSASGKTTIKKKMLALLPEAARTEVGWDRETHGPICDAVDLDNYYRNFKERRAAMGDRDFFSKTNLDSPDALTLGQATRDMIRIKNGRGVKTPVYQFSDCDRKEAATTRTPAPFFFTEGLFALTPEKLRKVFDLRIFVDTPEKVRAKRWWQRAPERNIQDDEGGRALFNRTMAEHNRHVEPAKAHANVVLSGAADVSSLDDALKRFLGLLVNTFYPVG